MKALLTIAVLLLAGILSVLGYNSYQAHQQRQEDAAAFRALDDINAKRDACKNKRVTPVVADDCKGSKAYCDGQRLGLQMSQEVHADACDDEAKQARNEWATKYPRQAARSGQ
jgi:predicted negative regulator of RcsB-dependent stress response